MKICIVQTLLFFVCTAIALPSVVFGQGTSAKENQATALESKQEKKDKKDKKMETITFGSGCFWCTEAIFQRIKGVDSVVSGYCGGTKENPTYKEVCTGETGHAEVIQVKFDPAVVSFDELLEVFWKMHDPTTLNQQGNDFGTQYRSAIFFSDDDQRKLAEEYKAKLNKEVFDGKVVTEITELGKFYPAEKYHQNYFQSNKSAGYCRMVIAPKVEKFDKVFKDKKKSAK
jgi:peptide-methionine (S)-S-oxide reductase